MNLMPDSAFAINFEKSWKGNLVELTKVQPSTKDGQDDPREAARLAGQ
jgi:hypothetical protein